jgi:hypothetical protein
MKTGYKKTVRLSSLLMALFAAVWLATGCTTIIPRQVSSVYLPYIKNSPNECYYLDDFMPVPDGMVKGKNGALSLRYYSYKSATYKDWEQKHIILSFYSQDERCWSLFEEYYVKN